MNINPRHGNVTATMHGFGQLRASAMIAPLTRPGKSWAVIFSCQKFVNLAGDDREQPSREVLSQV
ncbi:hypothetical protein [Pandoraea sp.]|uniref:hypothetical protein n=1 Tax=Pandoraea sp. TaxID=1883445 RepID=UPI0012062A5D|nr:hypothetical protein [Pandoraea sp.]MDE2289640.1 hypothetical protein [Burkholderiales bacterium]MDE2611519.1 hypothetical protein [Burkholderiales bacterium]TAL52165.1 MAG: hypothetical protein EPN80_20325 [Pandoraea sp.]TAM17286.1 MAG: hypothetical protein EPN65_11360 [Pandoraea sp.]